LRVANSNLGDYRAARSDFAATLAGAPNHLGALVGAALLDIRFGRTDAASNSLARIEARRAACAGSCRDSAALQRAADVIRHFLTRPAR
jgi:hypothetical protein